jgi:hypothetical protein
LSVILLRKIRNLPSYLQKETTTIKDDVFLFSNKKGRPVAALFYLNIHQELLFLFSSPFIDDKKIIFIIKEQITVFIAKVVRAPFFRLQYIGKIIEIITFCQHLFLAYLGLVNWVQFLHNAPVFAKYIIHVPNMIGRITVQTIIVCIPALIGAELLINTTRNYFIAFQTFFLFHI